MSADYRKPTAKRLGAGFILVIAVALLLGLFLDTCGFKENASPIPTTDAPDEPTPDPDVGRPVDDGPTARLRVLTVRGDAVAQGERALDWTEFVAVVHAASRADHELKLVVHADTVTAGFMNRLTQELARVGVRYVADYRRD